MAVSISFHSLHAEGMAFPKIRIALMQSINLLLPLCLCHCPFPKPYNAICILMGKVNLWCAGGAGKLAGFVSSCCLPCQGSLSKRSKSRSRSLPFLMAGGVPFSPDL